MMSLNYEPQHLKQAEAKLEQLFNAQEKTVLFVSVGKNMTEALESYANTNQHLSAFKEQGLIKAYASAEQFLISPEEQQKRLEQWNQYWGESGKISTIRKYIEDAARTYHFRKVVSIHFTNGWNTHSSPIIIRTIQIVSPLPY